MSIIEIFGTLFDASFDGTDLSTYDFYCYDIKKPLMPKQSQTTIDIPKTSRLIQSDKKFISNNLKIIFKSNAKAKEQYKKYKVKFNTEFVPAENLGVKNAKWDKEDGLFVPRDCYNSYFYPSESSEVNILDKFILHGDEIVKYLDGGSALHLALLDYPTQEGFEKLFDIATETGCNYFTWNVPVTCCDDCGYIDKYTTKECRKCGSKNIDYATRIIGYLRKIGNFSKERQIEALKRNYQSF